LALKNIFHELKAFIMTEKAFFAPALKLWRKRKKCFFVFGGKVHVAILSFP